MFDTVIFDWDGTLADTRKPILASFHQALQEILQTDVPDEFIERRIGMGASDTFKDILKTKNIPIGDVVIRGLLNVKIRVQVSFADKVRLFPGARELLEALQGKVKVALASMNNRPVIDSTLKALKVKKCFTEVVTRDEVSKSKPDPEIFLKTALKIGSDPANCVVFEDSIFGVEAAKAAGMACIAVLTGVYSRAELEKAKPDLIVESLSQKGAILRLILT